MTNREKLLADGYVVFESCVPEDLRARAETIINNTTPDPCFVWADDVARDFRIWGQNFLESANMNLRGWAADIHIFNRRPGQDPLYWHDDNSHNHPFYKVGHKSHNRRVFCCTYFTPTFNGRSPLRVIPKSHHGGYAEFRTRFTTMRLLTSNIEPLPPYSKVVQYTGDSFKEFPDIWSDHPDEKILEVLAGTMVVCDERILHSAAANRHTERRPMALWWLEKTSEDKDREAEFAALDGIPLEQ